MKLKSSYCLVTLTVILASQIWGSEPVPQPRFSHPSLMSLLKESNKHENQKRRFIQCDHTGWKSELVNPPKSIFGVLSKSKAQIEDQGYAVPNKVWPMAVWTSGSPCKVVCQVVRTLWNLFQGDKYPSDWGPLPLPPTTGWDSERGNSHFFRG